MATFLLYLRRPVFQLIKNKLQVLIQELLYRNVRDWKKKTKQWIFF